MSVKKFLVLAALATSVAATPVHAGGMAEPVMEAEVIAEETNTSGGFLVPLLLLAAIIAIASSGGGGSGPVAGGPAPIGSP